MPSDVPVAGMLKSYKKVSRWYPALDPASQAPVLEPSDGDAVFDDERGPARFPHYIQDAEPEDEIPPVPESMLRRNHFDGAWSDWMTGRGEVESHTPPPRYRGSAVVEFPSDADETGTDRASQLLDAVSDEVPAKRGSGRARRLFGLGFLIVAIVLLAIAGGVALYVLNSHGGTAQSIGTAAAGPGSGPIAVVAAYNEMTAPAIIGDHGPAASVPAG
ncbi:hypothetical protein VMT65_10760 [Nocardia sp. CDC153]|uniref:hypothetical protein n=1 Tax=Nocardia sp. CDC153 TaxID=3112167 RepID=UPI002DB8EC8E|nr:hypothetical protein [Nocardia sp. CDC153]MEC3953512.1 hypothetical protein [Nocardia sp. CDC153]